MKKVELLSPAGDLERLKIACIYGADAVYIGGKNYSLRANANNFSIEEIKEACDFAHKLGKRVYLTLNIVFHNEDIDGVYDYIKEVVEAGIDAFIVSDLFLVKYIKSNFSVEVHLSTQDSVSNLETVKFLENELVDRVVPAREVGRDELKEIIDNTNMDIEVFIHGAMCTFVSGRCVLSNYFTNRDSNRGGCAQICRFCFSINDMEEPFSMAVKDLNMSKYIKDMIEIGITSFKVEGRMRSPFYLAVVLSSYRRIIDAVYNDTLTDDLLEKEVKILSKVSNRENSSHFYFKEADLSDQYYVGRQEVSNQDYLGIIINREGNLYTINQRNYFKKFDEIEIITPNMDIISYRVDNLYNDKMESIDVANQADSILKIEIPLDLPLYSMIRKPYL
ncbi:MAG: U32 family peptidase [Bacilli bacterium]|nr:U32 family peptidase [Bacilli bacterium]